MTGTILCKLNIEHLLIQGLLLLLYYLMAMDNNHNLIIYSIDWYTY